MTALITMVELANKTEAELAALHRVFTDLLTQSAPGSSQRRTALANLENIARARANLNAGPMPTV